MIKLSRRIEWNRGSARLVRVWCFYERVFIWVQQIRKRGYNRYKQKYWRGLFWRLYRRLPHRTENNLRGLRFADPLQTYCRYNQFRFGKMCTERYFRIQQTLAYINSDCRYLYDRLFFLYGCRLQQLNRKISYSIFHYI